MSVSIKHLHSLWVTVKGDLSITSYALGIKMEPKKSDEMC